MTVELLSQAEAAQILHVDRTTVRRWELSGLIQPYQRIGNRPLYEREYILNFVKPPIKRGPKPRISTSVAA